MQPLVYTINCQFSHFPWVGCSLNVDSATFAWLSAEENDYQIAEASERPNQGGEQNRGQSQ